jgi:hypothetical protein
MSDLARLRIWDDPAIRDGLSWYLNFEYVSVEARIR